MDDTLLLLWTDVPLPVEMDLNARLMIRGLHIGLFHKLRKPLAFLFADFNALLSDVTEAHRFGLAGAVDRATPMQGGAVDVPGLPRFVQRYQFERWKWIAPKVHVQPITLPEASDTRVFLLKSGPGTKMVPHSHTGVEMTCVLVGAFRHYGGYFGPGDFDLGDETIEHEPVVEPASECISLADHELIGGRGPRCGCVPCLADEA